MEISGRLPSLRVKNDDGTTSKDSKYLWLCAFCSAATMILFVIANRLTTAANAIHHKKRNARHPLLNFYDFIRHHKLQSASYFLSYGIKNRFSIKCNADFFTRTINESHMGFDILWWNFKHIMHHWWRNDYFFCNHQRNITQKTI